MTQPPRDILDDLPSPSLVVDLEAVGANIAALDDALADSQVTLRPHFKAHRCSELLRLQCEPASSLGVTCATASEALHLVDLGFDDFLIANEIVDRDEVLALARVARQARVAVAVDSPSHVSILGSIPSTRPLSVVVDIDVGMGRCGVVPGTGQAVALAQSVAATPTLNFVGVMAYGGHIGGMADREDRVRAFEASEEIVAAEVRALQQAGFPCQVVTGGSTGDFDLMRESRTYNELQAGTYVLMDLGYGALDLPFRQAVFCLSRVVTSRPDGHFVLNAGWKALSAEKGMPAVVGWDAEVLRLADEHAIGRVASGPMPVVGDPVLLIPAHLDPTVNLHDRLVVWNGAGTTTWDVDGRRRSGLDRPW